MGCVGESLSVAVSRALVYAARLALATSSTSSGATISALYLV